MEISKASNEAWHDICNRHPHPFLDSDKYFEPFEKSIEYDNKKFRDEIIPTYDKMLSIFTDNFGLANPSTQKWYSEFNKFVELWHRWLDKSIPREAIEKIDYKEDKLHPFYEDLENQLEKLKKDLAFK